MTVIGIMSGIVTYYMPNSYYLNQNLSLDLIRFYYAHLIVFLATLYNSIYVLCGANDYYGQ